MRRAPLLLLLVSLCWTLAGPAPAAEFHVSPSGDDAAQGTQESPWRTLAHAQQQVRALRATGTWPARGVTVWLEPGRYPLGEGWSLGTLDGGSADAPVVYRSRVPGQAVLESFTTIPLDRWTPVRDAEVLEQLPEAARGQVLQADLKALKAEVARPADYFRDGGGLPDLYSNDHRLTPARWPNAGPAVMHEVLDKGDLKRTRDSRGGTFSYRENRISRWKLAADQQRLWLQGFWRVPWTFETVRVASLDPSQRQITLSSAVAGGLGSKYAGPQGAGNEPFWAIHLIEELDQRGEWCIDFSRQRLYLWPSQPLADSALRLSHRLKSMVRIQDASHLTLQGLALEGGLGHGIEITGGSGVTVAGCTLQDIGKTAVLITGGTQHQVLSCDVRDVGGTGITVTGGSRATLEPARHLVDNNHIQRVGMTERVYAPGIALRFKDARAIGVRVSHNRIHDTPHGGIIYSGNDNLIELNELYDVVNDSDDMGAFYTTYDWTTFGNVVRHNFVHHAPRATGTYADDGDSGDLFEGNIFYRVICGPFIGGGHHNTARNNISIASGRGVHIDSRGLDRGYASDASLFAKLRSVDVASAPWSERYPELATLEGDDPALPRGNVIERNVAVGCESVLHTGGKKDSLRRCRIENNHELPLEDMGFADPVNLDFRMSPDAAVFQKVPGFEPIPFERIGLYVSELRPRLPEREAVFSKARIPASSGKSPFAMVLVVDPIQPRPTKQQPEAQPRNMDVLTGTAGEDVEQIVYRLLGQPLKGEFPDAWTSVAIDPQTRRFREKLTLPEGGPYRLEVEARTAGRRLAFWNTGHLMGPTPAASESPIGAQP